MFENATRWTVVVNGLTVQNLDATDVHFDLEISIGHTFDRGHRIRC